MACVWSALVPMPSPDLLFEIDYTPSAPFSSLEALEPILAAAALDYSIAVIFHGPALSLLHGTDSPRWRQLIDFDLADLLTSTGIDGHDADGVRPINASEIEQLRKNARTILNL